MRRIAGRIALAIAALLIFGGFASSDAPISILVNGKTVTPDVPPTTIEGRTMVPVRFVAEALGCKVDWDQKTRTVLVTGTGSAPSLPPEDASLPPVRASFMGVSIILESIQYGQETTTAVIKIVNDSPCAVETGADSFYLVTDEEHVLSGTEETAPVSSVPAGESGTVTLSLPPVPDEVEVVTLISSFHLVEYKVTFEPEFCLIVD